MCNAAKQLVLDSDIAKPGQRFLAYRVAEIVNETHDHDFWANPATLADEVGVDVGTIRKYLRAMIDAGLMEEIERGGGPRRSTRYRFVGCAHLHGKKTGTLTAPHGAVTEPDAPDENLTAPHGTLTAPHGALTAPHGALTAPHGAAIENRNEPEMNQKEPELFLPAKSAGTKRPRDPVFDAIATTCLIDPDEITNGLGKRIGRTKREISATWTATDVELADEVTRRGRALARRFQSREAVTPESLAKHWASAKGVQRSDDPADRYADSAAAKWLEV